MNLSAEQRAELMASGWTPPSDVFVWGQAATAFRDEYRRKAGAISPKLDWSDALPAIVAGLKAAREHMPEQPA